MHEILTTLADLPPVLIYVLAALIVASETAILIGLLAPGEATLLLVGFLAYAGTLHLGTTMAVMIVACVAADAIAFRAGRRTGPRLRASRWGRRVGEHRWARADALLNRAGGRGVFVARWVAFARTLVPRLAGAAGMPYRRFAPWNALGVVTWAGGSVLLGYLAGESYETVSRYLGKATGAVFGLLAAIVVIVLVGRWLGRNPDPVLVLLRRAAALPPLRWLSARYGVLFFLLSMQIGAGWAMLANLSIGLGLLFAVGFAMAWLLAAVVRHSGLVVVDDAITAWFAGRRTDTMVDAALAVVSVLRGSFLILVVAFVAVVLAWRARVRLRQTDPLTVVSSAGAFLPLVVLAIVAEVVHREGGQGPPVTLFPTQNAVVTASLCTLAWLVARRTRRTRWPVAVAAWTCAAVGTVTVSSARLYVGWSTASETVTSVLLGVLWTAVFMIAWATRERTSADGSAQPVAAGPGFGAAGLATRNGGPA